MVNLDFTHSLLPYLALVTLTATSTAAEEDLQYSKVADPRLQITLYAVDPPLGQP